MTTPEAKAVVLALTAGGAPARFVGGCVRDALLERAVKDVDIATGLAPDEVMARLSAAGIKALPTGIEHGTVTAVIGKAHYEITTLRTDVESYGRRAKVAFTDDWMADAARRDFTINAMFASPDGTLYDPFGGQADLAAGRVRFVGLPRDRIREDVLRLLRFYRFFAHYGRGEMDAAGIEAARELAPLLPTLSGERVSGELLRLLAADNAAAILTLMGQHGVLEQLLPNAKSFDRLARLIEIERQRGLNDPLRRLAAALDAAAAGATAVGRKLRLSNRERLRLAAMSETSERPAPDLDRDACRQLLYRLGSEQFTDLVLLAWAAAEVTATGYAALLDRVAGWTPPKLPVRGRDVLALGVAPGVRVRTLLHAVESWWVAGGFAADREQCLRELARLSAISPA
ncbi:MAG: CCA tRNA nucleotidyltransferase [Alphaproteobacteria bacterium]|nr:CCA tRNA nucleotidyltransferase [Alphaproteobacteria bacterium]